jgi:bifunctional N-acetylglucosamine-1-phosphate-uridyltransferase/glucosamine-1-phosphate-acetyltransferase GlmU-like protein
VAESATDVLGINDRAAATPSARQRGIAADLMSGGVTLADPERLDVRGESSRARRVHRRGRRAEGKVTLSDAASVCTP